jgi:hypothetical protein
VLCAPGISSSLILSGKGNYDCLLGPRGISTRVQCSGAVDETIRYLQCSGPNDMMSAFYLIQRLITYSQGQFDAFMQFERIL